MRIFLRFIAAVFIVFFAFSAEASNLSQRVHEVQLKNGMKWLIVRRTGAPVFFGAVILRVGGLNETPGKTGLAHMFEHMAFKGSTRLGTKDYDQEKPLLRMIEDLGELREEEERSKKPDRMKIEQIDLWIKNFEKEADEYRLKNEVWEILMRNGANEINAFTSKDMTAYYASMPKNRLELWARVAAEMVFDPVFREFYIERDVVADERRSLTENNPNGEMAERILRAAYKDGPYRSSTIGSMEDIENLTIADAREFHRRYYVPGNMVGIIVGDVSITNAKKIIQKVFGGYERRPLPEAPLHSGEWKRGTYELFAFNSEPSIAIAYHKPTLPDKDEYVFDVITSLLCEGRSSRLEKKLVYDEKLARGISCSNGYPGSRLDNLLILWIEPLTGVPSKKILSAVEEEIEILRTSPASAGDLARVRKQVLAEIMFALDDNRSLGMALGRFDAVFGDWRILADYPEMISAVTPEDVIKVSNKFMTKDDRIVVERVKSR
ncbi:MAG TPA: pitrilysin family protein [bacterium]|nr:pitrilysin family protein [bacterium]